MTLLISRESGLVTVTLNRPEVRNAFNDVLINDLTSIYKELSDDTSVRAIILKGNGKHFCAGGDLNWMKESASFSDEENRADAMRLSDMFAVIDACPHPTFASVHGAAMGGAIGLLACLDCVIATEDARFALSEVRLGLTPATISPFVIRAIGERWARRLFLTAETFDGAHAATIGLVHETTDSQAAADNRTTALAIQCASHAQGAVRDAKQLIKDVAGEPITQEIRAMTAERIARRRASAEGREGLSAFLSKRQPNWSGSNP